MIYDLFILIGGDLSTKFEASAKTNILEDLQRHTAVLCRELMRGNKIDYDHVDYTQDSTLI